MPRFPLLKNLLHVTLFASLTVSGASLAQEDDDADILAPAEPDEVKKPVATKKKVGFVPLVPVGDANRPLADQVAEGLTKEFEEADFAVAPLALSSGTAGGDHAFEQNVDQLLEGGIDGSHTVERGAIRDRHVDQNIVGR